MVGALRFDAGNIAPRVRVLLGLSYFRSNFNQSSLNDFANKIRALVNDPDSNFTVNVGQIRWSDLAGDLDLQYAFKNAALAALVGPVFDRIAGNLVDAFVKRAEQVYG